MVVRRMSVMGGDAAELMHMEGKLNNIGAESSAAAALMSDVNAAVDEALAGGAVHQVLRHTACIRCLL